MRFAFTEDQLSLRDAVRALLAGECAAAAVRDAWHNDTGRVPGLWSALGANGVLGVTAPESAGGLDLSETELVLILEESGRAAVPEPLLETAALAIPALRDSSNAAARDRWLAPLVAGEASASVALSDAPHAPYANTCDIVIVEADGGLWLAERDTVELSAQKSVDHTRRLFAVGFDRERALPLGPSIPTVLRATIGASAQLVGLSRRMLDLAVEYAKVRTQFGKPIGTFQAVQHRLADALRAIEFAAPVVYRAAWSMANRDSAVATHPAMAKVFASEAAISVAKASLQVHGAIGYSTEYDLHLFMKRAWALAHAYGDARTHRRALARRLLDTDH